jgi:gliding motility-associated-like protein
MLILLCASARAQVNYPLIENLGQWPTQVAYSAEIGNGKLYIEDNGFTYDLFDAEVFQQYTALHSRKEAKAEAPQTLPCHAYKVNFVGSNENSKWSGKNPEKTTYSYFLGKDKEKWAGGAKSFEGITKENLYPGIDLKLYNGDFFLKYDLIVAPEADAAAIEMNYDGVDRLKLDNGRLIIKTSVGKIIEQKPLAYQMIDGQKRIVPCNYSVKKNNVQFEFPEGYDKSYELVIDPELVFSTYSGSSTNNFGYTATFDSEGFLYSGSSAFGAQYPTTTGAYDVSFNSGIVDIALSKFDTTGTFLVWSTYIGGNDDELPHSLIVNAANELFVYGTTSSTNYPTTDGAYDSDFNGGEDLNLLTGLGVSYSNGSDIVVSRISSEGDALLASTYIGGSDNDGLNAGTPLKFNYADEIRGEILIDNQNNIYIASSTNSTDFPVTENAIQSSYGGGGQDGCLIKMNNSLTTVFWSSYLGGSEADAVYSVDLTAAGDAVVAGGTRSTDFPVTFGAYQSDFAGGNADGFITAINPAGDEILFSSYYGSDAYDQIYFVELDQQDRVHVFGQTQKAGDHFIENASYNTLSGGQFITKFEVGLDDIIWSTAFGAGGGVPDISPTAFLVDVCNKIYLSGWGSSIQGGSLSTSGLDITGDAFQLNTDGNDFYLMVLEDDASNLFYASHYGGGSSAEHVDGGTSRFSRKGEIYQAVCAGCGGNSDFPIEPNPGAVSSVNNSSCNLGVFKFNFEIPGTIADFSAPSVICFPEEIAFNNNSVNATSYTWNFGDGSTSGVENPTHTYSEPGTYTVELIAQSPTSCNLADTVSQQVIVLSNSSSSIENVGICPGESEQIGISPSSNPNITYQWTPDDYLSDTDVPNPIASPPVSTTYTLLVSNGTCTDTIFQSVDVTVIDLTATPDTMLCGDEGVATLTAQTSLEGVEYTWSASEDFSNPLNDGPEDADVEVNVAAPSTFYVQAELNGCTAEESVNVNLTSQFTDAADDFTICEGNTATLNVINPSDLLDYFWEPDELILSGQNTSSATVAPESETTYYLTATYGEDCIAYDTVTVSISTLNGGGLSATADPEVIPPEGNSQLAASPDGYSYEWSPTTGLSNSNSQNPLASPDQTTTYYVTVSDGDCFYLDSVRVTVIDFECGPPSIFVPNAFTPNGDQNNDVLYVEGQNLTSVELSIFDRWGEKVFETSTQSEGWDGSYKGVPVEPAVFVYKLKATCDGGIIYEEEGNVTVIR